MIRGAPVDPLPRDLPRDDAAPAPTVRRARRFVPTFDLPDELSSGFESFRLDLGGHLVLHALAVGAIVGLGACFFFVLLQTADAMLLRGLSGYRSLRPAGEVELLHFPVAPHPLSLVVVAILPALGGLARGLVARRAPEVEGGGGDSYITSFHGDGTPIRRRVAWLKMLATALTLGTGGSAGREGPTMQVGAAIASWLGTRFSLSPRERRLLLVAGTAAGLAAMFGTPLGAALLATEVLYQDDFEPEALIPAVLASAVAYSVFLAVFPGTGHLFGHAARYPFRPADLPYYAMLALFLGVSGRVFVRLLEASRKAFARVPWPTLRPALGGLALGVLAATWLALGRNRLGLRGVDVGALGAGYGAVQAAILDADFLPSGWAGVGFFASFALLKMLTTSLTLGSGGSGGDFGPSLVIGGLLGGAFGRAVVLVSGSPADPGAFALVGMGAFYGGLANAPVSAVVLVCEMTGTYDLLVPLMLASVLGHVAMKRANLYHAQPASRAESPAHRVEAKRESLDSVPARALLDEGRRFVVLHRDTTFAESIRIARDCVCRQETIPMVDDDGSLVALVATRDLLRVTNAADLSEEAAVPAGLVRPPDALSLDDSLHVATRRIVALGLHALPMIDDARRPIALVDLAELASFVHAPRDPLSPRDD